MKRLTAIILSLALLITFIPFGTSAEEGDSLISKAATVFPEYADKLLHPSDNSSGTATVAADRVLIIKETRAYSDKETITYSEYSDGVILLSSYECDYQAELVEETKGSTYRQLTINITASCVYGSYTGYFYLNGVSYTLNTGVNVYDKITSAGTAKRGTNCVKSSRTTYTKDESATGYARVAYSLQFKINNQTVSTILSLSVGEDTAVGDHYSN